MSTLSLHILLPLVALMTSAVVFPFTMRFAIRHNIMDTPDKRKLQTSPVPVFGGVTVVAGLFIPLCVAANYYNLYDLWYVIGAIMVLLTIGVTDDVRGLPATFRFVVEVLLIWVLIWRPYMPENGPMIDNLYGLFGRNEISVFTAMPLTIVAGVGIINSINLIDGIDGYSSGYGILASSIFATMFFHIGNHLAAIFSLICAAALIPFFFHNVFGKTSKMFLGDGGSLTLGMVMVYNVLSLLSTSEESDVLQQQNMGVVAFALAVLSVPVFDTLRVMCARIWRHESPFTPDKTHLHHLFIDLGFSHFGTTLYILIRTLLCIGLWDLAYRLGVGITGQFFIVVLLGLWQTTGFYYLLRHAQTHNTALYRFYCRLGAHTHAETCALWQWMQRRVDGKKGF